jgi:hypothetical protein
MSWHSQPSTATNLIADFELVAYLVPDFNNNTSSITAGDEWPGFDKETRAAHKRITGTIQS